MKQGVLIVLMSVFVSSFAATASATVKQTDVNVLKQKSSSKKKLVHKKITHKKPAMHDALVSVHALDKHPEALEFAPAALMADNNVVTYIAGMPVVSSPYLGARPAFDGWTYFFNFSKMEKEHS